MALDSRTELFLYAGMVALWGVLVVALIALLVTAIIWIWRHMACSLLIALIALMINHLSAE